MSRTQSTPDPRRLECLREYLHQRALSENGEFYSKSKFMAKDLEMSSSEVGALIPFLREAENGLTIEKWSYTNATTWRVAVRDVAD